MSHNEKVLKYQKSLYGQYFDDQIGMAVKGYSDCLHESEKELEKLKQKIKDLYQENSSISCERLLDLL